ncbi:3-methyladenine DNA glycosylase AlkD [Chitinophaga skermanii]|uniref:3-methyladenine DNA glycosylase AlkD n=1 Tax=Chitinophaga skermanii TaxID=331697 RepID=A0A327QD09_9BACT|nr:DNA alkylation repair protein [Chitinophaga skermanii]RAJ01718.1 3-methyladenine DNA glycosylase AlkD [Chitinophaga skermanii]
MSISYVSNIVKHFRAAQNKERATAQAAYMRDQFTFIGITSPERKQMLQAFRKEHGLPGIEELHHVVKALWELPERDFQYIAMEILDRYRKHYRVNDLALFEYCITEKSWWDTVDLLATHCVGDYFLRFPQHKETITQSYMDSGNMWLQRTAILFQLNYKDKTDEDLLFEYILALASSKEFFIQKAIGWALRQYAKLKPNVVKHFVEHHTLAPLSKREALKHF